MTAPCPGLSCALAPLISPCIEQFHPQIVVTSSKTPDQQFSECIDRIKNQNGVQVIYLPAKNFRYLSASTIASVRREKGGEVHGFSLF